MAEVVHRRDPEPATLGEYLYRERQRTATLQRVLTARSGVSQPNIAAYERGRRQPSWSVFVRLINAMNRRPVLTTEPLEPPAELHRRVISLESVVQEVLEVVGDRAYRFEHNAAARPLGLDLPIDFVHVSVVGDPDRLDELAIRAVECDRSREVMTHRGLRIKPQVHFFAALAAVALEVVAVPRDSVVVVLNGRQVHVAPMEQLRVKPLL